jgi:hypothetical protein
MLTCAVIRGRTSEHWARYGETCMTDNQTKKSRPAKVAALKPVKEAKPTFKAVTLADLITDADAMKKACKSIHTRGQSLQRDVHIMACSVLRHIQQHGDVRMIATLAPLMSALPESYRTNALRDWFSAYGPVAWANNAPVYVKGGETKLGAAMLDPFWKFKPEAPYVPVDVQKLIASTIKKLETDTKETKVDHSAVIALLETAKEKAVTAH